MRKTIVYILIGIILSVFMSSAVLGYDFLQPSIASKILRFHVLAHSDSAEDQAVKEKVRDAVGIYLQPLLTESNSLDETKRIIEENMEKIEEVSRRTLKEYGYDYPVAARITNTEFPEKTYGAYTFPKGEYEALQISIGSAKGQNWWCVLYPNMCFRGTVFEVVEESAGEALREVLSPWEYADVFDSGKVEVRFKFLEFFR